MFKNQSHLFHDVPSLEQDRRSHTISVDLEAESALEAVVMLALELFDFEDVSEDLSGWSRFWKQGDSDSDSTPLVSLVDGFRSQIEQLDHGFCVVMHILRSPLLLRDDVEGTKAIRSIFGSSDSQRRCSRRMLRFRRSRFGMRLYIDSFFQSCDRSSISPSTSTSQRWSISESSSSHSRLT